MVIIIATCLKRCDELTNNINTNAIGGFNNKL